MSAAKTPEEVLERTENWSGYATLLILAGIVVEIGLILVYPHEAGWWERGVLIAANAMIGIGLAIEYRCIRLQIVASDEVRLKSEAKLAEALDRAAQAQRELIAFKTPRRAAMTPENRKQFEAALKPFYGTPFDVGVGNDGEQADFLWDLEEVLQASGWSQLDWMVHHPNITVVQRNQRPLAGSVSAQNVEIHFEDPALTTAGDALMAAIKSIGLEASIAKFNAGSVNRNAMHVLVGAKR